MRDAAPAPPVSRSATARDQRRWSTLAVVVVSILVVFLDGMVLNVALPRIQQELGASQGKQEWAVAAYTLVFAALLLPFGAVGDRLGRRRILTAGLAVFGAASAVAAYAGSPIELILMRAVMGVGAAAILPSTLAIITNTFDEDERGRAIAIWAAASGLAVPLGPLVGGAMLDAGFWWGSVLLINVPIVLVALVGVRRLVPESRDPTEPEVDRLGVLLSVAGLGLLVYGVIRAGQTAEWTSRATIGAIAGGIALLVVFVWLEATSNHAALDVRWFRQPALATASGAMALAMFALFGAMLYGIYYLQFDRGYSPLGAGVLLLGNAAAVVVFAPLSAALAKRHGHRRVCATGLVVLAAAYAGMATIDRDTHIAVVELLLIALGAGSALVIAPTTDLVMAAIPKERAGAASALNSAVRSVGGAIGIAVLGSVLSTAYRSGIGSSVDVLPTAARDAAGESIGGTQAVVAATHDSIADHGASLLEAASRAFTDAMHLTAALSTAAVFVALAVVLVWMPRRADTAEIGRASSTLNVPHRDAQP
jgi:DHA2 family integral membrane protein (MFS transporter)